MKKITAIFLSFILVFLFIAPVSAKTSNNERMLYQTLDAMTEQLVNREDVVGAVRFNELSDDSLDYLEELGVDTSSVGKAFYMIEEDVLALKTITVTDGEMIFDSFITYSKNGNGDYERVDDPTLIGDLRSWNPTTWASKTVTKTVDGAITITSRAYYYYQYVNSVLYINPYKSEAKFVYASTPHATVKDLYVHTEIYGELDDYDFNYVALSYVWYTNQTIANPVDNTIYTAYSAMPANRIFKGSTCMLVMYGTVKINGTEKGYQAYVPFVY